MEQSVATASKNIARIKCRKYVHYAFRAGQKLFGDRVDANASSILLLPKFSDSDALSDVLNRLAWFLPSETTRPQCEIHVVASQSVYDRALDTTPESQSSYPVEDLPLSLVGSNELSGVADAADKILVWKKTAVLSPSAVRHPRKLEMVDPSYYSATEPNTWERVTDVLRSNALGDSQARLEALADRASSYDRAFVFGTGPSLADAMKFDFPDDSLKIICNSIVKNDELLEHLDPDVLTFADPVFHFGPSQYADRFRSDAVDVLREYDCVGVIPPEYRSLMTGHYPEVDFAAVDRERDLGPHFPTVKDPRVWSTGNIMTLYMLPLASWLCDEVYILGADGRQEDESYFWEHNDEAQYDDEVMQTVADSHPAFFRDRVYTDYYQRHVDILTEMIEYGERRGVDYRSLTHSYVPCLSDRRVRGINAQPRNQ